MTLVSCSDDSNSAPPPGTSDVPQSILAQFSEDYPDARDVLAWLAEITPRHETANIKK